MEGSTPPSLKGAAPAQDRPSGHVIVIGAGPAGLTAALELLRRSSIRPLVLEATGDVGGISKTVVYRGNRLDLGGHRFFTKSDRVMAWWKDIFPVEGAAALAPPGASASPGDDKVFLVRPRVSRILFERRLYPYPLQPSLATLRALGLRRVASIAATYAWARVRPRVPETSLEDFFVNRFGRTLYETFFRDYTQKVWGVPCSQISPEWGGQRVKGLSMGKALWDWVRHTVAGPAGPDQKRLETSLIRQFLYPKLGPGQLWEEVALRVKAMGGQVLLHHRVVGLESQGQRIRRVIVRDELRGTQEALDAEAVFSSMPVNDLVAGLKGPVPQEVREIAHGLPHRAFITVGVLLTGLRLPGAPPGPIPDTWIYVQEGDMRVGRIQIFNNWSPYLVADPSTVWVGLEYFCDEGDEFWSLSDADIARLAVGELVALGLASPHDVLDHTVVRVPKAYPAYFGTYHRFGTLRRFLDQFENLFLIGRNGMHRYNNQDHSMLTAMRAVDVFLSGGGSKEAIWSTNTEEEYLEEK